MPSSAWKPYPSQQHIPIWPIYGSTPLRGFNSWVRVLVLVNRMFVYMWKSMNQWSEQPSLVFLRSKTNFHWTYCRCANKRKPSSNSDFCYDYYLGNYTSAPHSLFQKLRLFSFSTLSCLTPKKGKVLLFGQIWKFSSVQGSYCLLYTSPSPRDA